MAIICYHASHEQFSPSHLLSLVQRAQKAHFQGIHASDHFHPWSEQQGQSGFTLSWIGAAMQATTLPFSMVCAPGQRLHPAIVAQAIATLCEMFPGRFNIELGSGEAINESITGAPWPPKELRNKRLLESYHVIKALLLGKEVNKKGCVHVRHAKLYTRPTRQPLLLCAALSRETAAWAGTWADGLLTTAGEVETVQRKITAFRENGGLNKPVYIQIAFSYARNYQAALNGAFDQWRANILPIEQLSDFSQVKQFEQASKSITVKNIQDAIPIFSDMLCLHNQLRLYTQMGVDRIILHNVNSMQEEFIEDFGLSIAT